jgi:hypothetical protein
VIGIMTLATSLRARRGARTVCARCDYPMGSWRRAAPQCPECGSAWQQPWGARFGFRAVSVRGVQIGLALIGLSLLLLASFVIWGLPGR